MKYFKCLVEIAQNISSLFSRGITPKRVTSGGAHLRDLAPGPHSSEETSQRWRVVDTVIDLIGLGIKPRIYHTDSNALKKITKTNFYRWNNIS